MIGFNYIRNLYSTYLPKTPKSALRAVEEGFVPPEAFVYLSANIKPLFEEPFDLEEIDRVLARPKLDLQTNLLLIRILEKLIDNKDSEIALFAAESINAIENRYNDVIQALKTKIEKLKKVAYRNKKPNNPNEISSLMVKLKYQLAKNYYEFALLNNSREVLRKFYLREAFQTLNPIISKDYKNPKRILRRPVLLGVQSLIALGLHDHARNIFRKHSSLEQLYPCDFQAVKIEIEYYARNIESLRGLIAVSNPTCNDDPVMRNILENWRISNTKFDDNRDLS